MVRWNHLCVALATVTALVPVVSADVSTCAVQSDPNAMPFGPYYLKYRSFAGVTTVSVWSETNGFDGLQTSPTPCGYKQPTAPADTLVGTASNSGELRLLIPDIGPLAEEIFAGAIG